MWFGVWALAIQPLAHIVVELAQGTLSGLFLALLGGELKGEFNKRVIGDGGFHLDSEAIASQTAAVKTNAPMPTPIAALAVCLSSVVSSMKAPTMIEVIEIVVSNALRLRGFIV